MLAASSFCRLPKCVDQAVDDGAGQARHLGQQAVAARADRRRRGASPTMVKPSARAPAAEVEQLGGGRGPRGRRAPPRRVRPALAVGQVVADDQLAVVAEAADELLELEA